MFVLLVKCVGSIAGTYGPGPSRWGGTLPRLGDRTRAGFLSGGEPDLRFYTWDFLEAGWVCRNDRIAPEPGLTDAQLDRLALVYVAASVRRGAWLIPAFHAAVEAGIPEAHDDPQNFDLARWAERLGRLIGELAR